MSTCPPAMLSLSSITTKFHAPSLRTHFSSFLLLRRPSFSSTQTQIRMSSSSTTTTTTTIEHIVLFKIRDGTPDTQLSAMLNGLNGLKSLPMVQQISAGPLHRDRSTSLKFTHMLHSRYASKDDLTAYAVHPDHVHVVKSCVQPIAEDAMAIDWVAQLPESGSALKPGSALRVQFVKLKDGLGEKEKEEVLEVVGGLKEKVSGIEELTFGENFSPGRAKGFSIASIGIFKGLSELDAVQENVEIAKEKDKVRDYIDSLVIVDYVVPSPQSANL